MPAKADSETTPSSSLPFDPPGEVVTTNRLKAFMDTGRPMLNNYIRHAKVGGGQHGEVYLCYKVNPRLAHDDPERRIAVAMKSVKRDNPRAEQMKKLRQHRLPTTNHTSLADKLNTTEAKIRKEIAIMKQLRHPHVVRLYEVIDDRMKDKIYMVMEYLGGGEVKWRDSEGQPVLTVVQTRRIIRDAVLGLEYLHYQGIIHRDIKPANLLWTDDRRMVKIGDFGVSHFSYAQRLAAAGAEGAQGDPHDPILLDDSDLTRRAGTPAFLAPEIVFEHTNEYDSTGASTPMFSSGASSSTIQTPSSFNANRPPITKAIDIWALGVTLYCLLFGRTPFVASQKSHGSEWSLYNAICNDDWTVDETMGADQVPTWGRHPNQGTEGAGAIHLLDRLLQKDQKSRIKLESVKLMIGDAQSHSWILNDLPEPQRWLQLTSPAGRIYVSSDEASDAMSAVHFRWRWGVHITRRISSLFRKQRAQRVREPSPKHSRRGPVRSDPHLKIHQNIDKSFASSTPTVYHVASSPSISEKATGKIDKGKKRADSRHFKQNGCKSGSKSLRSRSIERWPSGPVRGTPAPITIQGSAPKKRRGSETILVESNNVGASSSQSSPTRAERPRARFAGFLTSISHWRPNKYSSSPPGPSRVGTANPSSSNVQLPTPITTTSRTTGARAQAGHVTRRSEEALRYYQTGPPIGDDEDDGRLTAARRASSWGLGDKSIEFAEVVSVRSVDHDLNEHDMNVGAGGISHERPFVLRSSSRMAGSSQALASALADPEHELDPADDQGVEDKYGPPCFDEDSSTIASGFDNEEEDGSRSRWRTGSDLDDDDDDGDGDDLGDDGDDDDDSQENVVTFSPRKRSPNFDED